MNIFDELAPLDVDDLRARRIRDAAHAELARASRPRPLRRIWRKAELALAAAMTLVYVGWVLDAMTQLYR
jgi:hypothetical protein